MDHDSTDHPKPPRKERKGSQPDVPPQDLTAADVDPATSAAEEDEEARLPDAPEEPAEAIAEGPLAIGHAAIENAVRLAPTSPGVYRMLNAAGDVLYVGKAKSIRKRILSYGRPTVYDPRIERMIVATSSLEFVSTATETEALLLEANLIKRLRPRFNVLLRDDKSFPYILITADHWAPQILKHRGARNRRGNYYGPFASVWAVNRTITALPRPIQRRNNSGEATISKPSSAVAIRADTVSAPVIPMTRALAVNISGLFDTSGRPTARGSIARNTASASNASRSFNGIVPSSARRTASENRINAA